MGGGDDEPQGSRKRGQGAIKAVGKAASKHTFASTQ